MVNKPKCLIGCKMLLGISYLQSKVKSTEKQKTLWKDNRE